MLRCVVFLEDSRYVGFWPSHVDALRQAAEAFGFVLEVIDMTADGWWPNDDALVTRHPGSVYTNGGFHTLADGSEIIAVEKARFDDTGPVSRWDGVEPVEFTRASYPPDSLLVFGPHNGLDASLVKPDSHVYVPSPYDQLDVREIMTLVLWEGYR